MNGNSQSNLILVGTTGKEFWAKQYMWQKIMSHTPFRIKVSIEQYKYDFKDFINKISSNQVEVSLSKEFVFIYYNPENKSEFEKVDITENH